MQPAVNGQDWSGVVTVKEAKTGFTRIQNGEDYSFKTVIDFDKLVHYSRWLLARNTGRQSFFK